MKLSHDICTKKIEAIPQWTLENDRISRSLRFDSFMDAIAFINAIATLAEKADHHPEIFNVYNRIDLVLTTHDCHGLSEKDFKLAAQIDLLL